jgi:sugar lactone lactonase YvrE
MKKIAGGYSIVEGPVWNRASSSLIFADGLDGGILSLRWQDGQAGEAQVIVPKRRCSGIALHERGGLVMSGRNVGWKHGEQSARLLELDPALGMAYFNDLGTSLEGRVYVGSLDYDFSNPHRAPTPGYLHVIDLDGSSRIVADGIGTANGVAVSPDGRELYFDDTYHQLVRRYAVLPNGDLIEQLPLIDFSSGAPGDGPDGNAVAADGSVWVALHESGCVAVVDRDGRERSRFQIPGGHLAASLCFGGDDLRTLFVTTFHKTDTGEQDSAIFVMPVDVAGAPVPPARVKLPVQS